MKILIRHSFCEIKFEENDKYCGRTLLVSGERGVDKEFFIYKSLLHEMDWLSPTSDKPNRCIPVAESERGDVLDYVIQEAQKTNYSLVLW